MVLCGDAQELLYLPWNLESWMNTVRWQTGRGSDPRGQGGVCSPHGSRHHAPGQSPVYVLVFPCGAVSSMLVAPSPFPSSAAELGNYPENAVFAGGLTVIWEGFLEEGAILNHRGVL